MRQNHLLAGAALLTALAFAHPAFALTMKECSVKYKAEQEAGTLVAKSWNDFRKAECGPGATLEAKKPGKTARKRRRTLPREPRMRKLRPQGGEVVGVQADRGQGHRAWKDGEAGDPRSDAKGVQREVSGCEGEGELGWRDIERVRRGGMRRGCRRSFSTTKSGMVFPKAIAKKYATNVWRSAQAPPRPIFSQQGRRQERRSQVDREGRQHTASAIRIYAESRQRPMAGLPSMGATSMGILNKKCTGRTKPQRGPTGQGRAGADEVQS